MSHHSRRGVEEGAMGKEMISGECPYCRAPLLATDRDELGIKMR